jgi:hypothetical protein
VRDALEIGRPQIVPALDMPVRYSRIFPYTTLDQDGVRRVMHGAVIDGKLVCSRECLDALRQMAPTEGGSP